MLKGGTEYSGAECKHLHMVSTIELRATGEDGELRPPIKFNPGDVGIVKFGENGFVDTLEGPKFWGYVTAIHENEKASLQWKQEPVAPAEAQMVADPEEPAGIIFEELQFPPNETSKVLELQEVLAKKHGVDLLEYEGGTVPPGHFTDQQWATLLQLNAEQETEPKIFVEPTQYDEDGLKIYLAEDRVHRVDEPRTVEYTMSEQMAEDIVQELTRNRHKLVSELNVSAKACQGELNGAAKACQGEQDHSNDSVPEGFAAQVLATVRDRGDDYGTPSTNHQLTADLFSAWLSRRLRQDIRLSAEDVCLLNAIQKMSRLAFRTKNDSLLDISGYVENIAMLHPKQRNS